MNRTVTKRAYDSAAKEARHQAILDAASGLFATTEQMPSVSQIAEAAGLAKGTVYLYFRTKEEIFAFLLQDGWRHVLEGAGQALTAEPSPVLAIASFVDAYSEGACSNGNLLRLDALSKGLLEENMTPEALDAFKTSLFRQMQACGALIEEKLDLSQGRGDQLLIRSYALTRGLWQTLGVSNIQECRSGEGPYEFQMELRQALAEYWQGALRGGREVAAR